MSSQTRHGEQGRAPSVLVSFIDSYEQVFGPPGARGQPETGRQIIPPHPDRDNDRSLRRRIEESAKEQGLVCTADCREQDIKVARFDFASVKDITDMLVAAGSGAAALAFLRGCRQLVAEWLKGRATRQISVKMPDGVEVHIKGDNDIAKALHALQQLQEKTRQSSTPEPSPAPGLGGQRRKRHKRSQ